MEIKVLESSLKAHPRKKDRCYAIHFRAIFGIMTETSFPFSRCVHPMESYILIPRYNLEERFNSVSLGPSSKFSIKGKMVAGNIHAIKNVCIPELWETIARVVIPLSIRWVSPDAENQPNKINMYVPLWVRKPTGPYAKKWKWE